MKGLVTSEKELRSNKEHRPRNIRLLRNLPHSVEKYYIRFLFILIDKSTCPRNEIFSLKIVITKERSVIGNRV